MSDRRPLPGEAGWFASLLDEMVRFGLRLVVLAVVSGALIAAACYAAGIPLAVVPLGVLVVIAIYLIGRKMTDVFDI